MTIRNIIIGIMVMTFVAVPQYAHAVRCDNDNYYNGWGCMPCPMAFAGTLCSAGPLDDFDGESCEITDSGVDGANSGCGVGNQGELEGENPGINTCRIFAYDGQYDTANDIYPQCVYCDKTGCFVMAESCFYK